MDLDGDGLGDLGVSAPAHAASTITNAGAIYLIQGGAGLPGDLDLADADATLTGNATGDKIEKMANAGDVNGDGHADLLIGSDKDDTAAADAGAAFVFFGGALPDSGALAGISDAVLTGVASTDYAGSAVAGPGDVNVDGTDDLWIGSRGVTSTSGAAYLVYGPVLGSMSLSDADARWTATGLYDAAGAALAGAGDADGNGRPDLMVAARSNDDGATDAGAVYLLLSLGY